MYGFRSQFVLTLLVGCFCLSLAAFVMADQGPKKRKPSPVQLAPVPAPSPDPPLPATLQEMPAAPPKVSYQQGQLTIISQNSTLGDILRAVRDKTGANFEVPGNANERVVGQMGPGSPRDVLAQLLNGSRFNYVILGSPTDSSKLERVILSVRPPDVQQNTTPAAANTAAPTPEPESGFNQPPADDEDEAVEPQPDQANPNQPPVQAPIRSPEQLLQELQRQQQQQQQSPPPGNPSERK